MFDARVSSSGLTLQPPDSYFCERAACLMPALPANAEIISTNMSPSSPGCFASETGFSPLVDGEYCQAGCKSGYTLVDSVGQRKSYLPRHFHTLVCEDHSGIPTNLEWYWNDQLLNDPTARRKLQWPGIGFRRLNWGSPDCVGAWGSWSVCSGGSQTRTFFLGYMGPG